MSEERRKEYNVYPKLQVYNVFNVAQTNLQEARPELYKKLEAAAGVNRPLNQGDDFSFPAMDKMIKENGWICPIKPVYGDNAYYSISKNEIVIPEKRQFKDGESFYTNLGHEMAHSTGSQTLARERQLIILKNSDGIGWQKDSSSTRTRDLFR